MLNKESSFWIRYKDSKLRKANYNLLFEIYHEESKRFRVIQLNTVF